MAKQGKCTCDIGMLLVALVLLSIGAYFLVAAFSAQLQARGDVLSVQTVVGILPWYFVGFLVMVLGKMEIGRAHV